MSQDGAASAGGFEAPEPAELTALLEGFEVHDLIACGGMGAVYNAEQLSLGREVAIKVLPRELAQDESFRASFEAEARAMAKLTHPNLIGVFDFGQVEGMLYLVMEFVNGDSLYAASHDQIVDPKQAVEIVEGIASGLGHAHGHGIVHRDIKPANILIGQDLIPKLGDFGLAVASDDVSSGMVMGTPGFVAPEVLADPNAASPASDVFALGALLHQLLTGIIPDWDSPPDIDLVPNLGNLRHVIRKSVALDPSMRFSDGTTMAKALHEWLEKAKKGIVQIRTGEALPGTAFGSASAPPVEIPQKSRFSMFSLVGLALVALIGGGVWFAMTKEEPVPAVASTPPADSSADPAKEPAGAPPEKMQEPPGAPPEPPPSAEPALDAEAVKAKYIAALREARTGLLADRTENRERLTETIQHLPNWAAYFAVVDDELQILPRQFPGSPVRHINTNLIQVYAIRNQDRIHDDHYDTIEDLHRDCLQELENAGEHPETGVTRVWEQWVEWLGLSPLDLIAQDLKGLWQHEPGDGRATVVTIRSREDLTVLLGGIEFSGDDLVHVTADGEITIFRSPDDRSKKWTLRWRNELLVGTDESGAECEFFRQDGGLHPSIDPKQPSDQGGPAGQPMDESGVPQYKDQELAGLQQKYLAAVHKQIEPLATGYRKVLASALALAERRDNARSIEQLSTEIVRLDGLRWRSGRVPLEDVDWDSVVPLSQQGSKSKFDRAFRDKMGKLQSTYIDQLGKLRSLHNAKRKDIAEVERELHRFILPPGTLKTHYVKLIMKWREGIRQIVIHELNILDANGEPYPQASLGIHGASSHQEAMEGNGPHEPGHVLDGNPHSFWHTRWGPERAPFPHWIAIDLKQELVISGFRVLPRQNDERDGDMIHWILQISEDGRKWTEAAEGGFPHSQDVQEFRFDK